MAVRNFYVPVSLVLLLLLVVVVERAEAYNILFFHNAGTRQGCCWSPSLVDNNNCTVLIGSNQSWAGVIFFRRFTSSCCITDASRAMLDFSPVFTQSQHCVTNSFFLRVLYLTRWRINSNHAAGVQKNCCNVTFKSRVTISGLSSELKR